eukprot:m.270714 g.270714  ORF g.270714 m.270714 type:complete len:79 (+) comp15682_c0_seq16:2567-2803(+)
MWLLSIGASIWKRSPTTHRRKQCANSLMLIHPEGLNSITSHCMEQTGYGGVAGEVEHADLALKGLMPSTDKRPSVIAT